MYFLEADLANLPSMNNVLGSVPALQENKKERKNFVWNY
jgi:hypothetical protein